MAASALTRLVVLHADVINVDEASYMVGASELLHGRLPYLAFGDNKPPLIYVFYALSQLIAGHGIGAVRLVTALLIVPLTAFAISAVYGHRREGLVGSLLFVIVSASYTASDMLAVNCEVVMMLPLAWAVAALATPERARRPEQAFGAGLLIGIGVLVKYQAALWVPPLAFAIGYAAWPYGRIAVARVLAALAIGVLLPLAATLTVFAAAGGLDGLLYWNVTHNLEYLQNPIGAVDAVVRAATHLGPFFLVTSPLWWGWMRSPACAPSRYWEMLVAGLIGASLAAACLGLRFFPHYFIQLYVPLALGAAPWASRTFTWPMRASGWAVATATVGLLAGWTSSNVARLHARTLPELNASAAAVASRIHEDACEGESSLFVWGSAPEFYYHAQLPVATQFFFPEYPLVPYYAGNPNATAARLPNGRRTRRMRHWSRLMTDLRRSRPAFILDTAPAGIARWQNFPVSDYPLLQRFIQRNYTAVGTVDRVVIYERRDCHATSTARHP